MSVIDPISHLCFKISKQLSAAFNHFAFSSGSLFSKALHDFRIIALASQALEKNEPQPF